ncbi:methyltransferase family protein [Marinomonas sp. 2405UD68-3]|uniref:methyltransferase family protein n=1 Tax=Marinomonas sp. 2405UD68-3 TaxID=3391835 RepID=UPI0039C98B03
MLTTMMKFPITLVILFGIKMTVFNIIGLSYFVEIPKKEGLSVGVFLLGAVVILVAGYSFKKANTTVNPATPELTSSLVTVGVFSLSRNPMYVGFLLFVTSFFIVSENLLNVVFIPLFIFMANRLYIMPEETALGEIFGNDFERYKARVRRWL